MREGRSTHLICYVGFAHNENHSPLPCGNYRTWIRQQTVRRGVTQRKCKSERKHLFIPSAIEPAIAGDAAISELFKLLTGPDG